MVSREERIIKELAGRNCSNPTRCLRYGRKHTEKVLTASAQSGKAVISVCSGCRLVSTPNKMVGKARQNSTGKSPNWLAQDRKAAPYEATALVWLQFSSLSQLAEENGSNPFKFRFESEVNYHAYRRPAITAIIATKRKDA